VKSMGVELRSRNLAQVSINLTDFEQTPMHRVFEWCAAKPSATAPKLSAAKLWGSFRKRRSKMTADFFFSWKTSSRKWCSKIAWPQRFSGTASEAAQRDSLRHGKAYTRSRSRSTPTPGGGSVFRTCRSVAAALAKWLPGSRGRKSPMRNMLTLSLHR